MSLKANFNYSKYHLKRKKIIVFLSYKEHYTEMKNFEVNHFSDYIKYIEQIISEFAKQFSDFKKLESGLSLFTQPLTIAIETVKTDYQ